MSLGYCGCMKLFVQDDANLLYLYCCYNLNNDDWWAMMKKEDGEITIALNSLVEPEISEKTIKLPSGRKKIIERRIPRGFNLEKLLNEELITIKNASGAWDVVNGIDRMALNMLYKLFIEYQESGTIPKTITYFT